MGCAGATAWACRAGSGPSLHRHPDAKLHTGPTHVARPVHTPQRAAHAPPGPCAGLPPAPSPPLPGGVLGLSGPQLQGLDLDATAPQEGRRFDMQVGGGGGAGGGGRTTRGCAGCGRAGRADRRQSQRLQGGQ